MVSILKYKQLIALLLFSFAFPVSASGLSLVGGEYRLTYDEVILPGDESMGLLGGSYLLRDGNTYKGIGTYSAVTGERGGFFTIGLELGYYLPLSSSWRMNFSGFVGGGGGGAAPQGGGMMLRESVSIEKNSGKSTYSLGLSAVQFPNGDIRSKQLSVGFNHRFKTLFAPMNYDLGMLDDDVLSLLSVGQHVGITQQHFSAHQKYYYPSSNSIMTTGSKQTDVMRLLGAKISYSMGGSRFAGVATYGANGGGVDGFAQLGLFVGQKVTWFESLNSHFEFHLAAAGGGRVQTGGGLMVGFDTSLNWLLSDGLYLGVEAGYITAPDGKFSAKSVGLLAGYQYDLLSIADNVRPIFSGVKFSNQQFRWRFAHQSYLPTDKSFRKGDLAAADDRRVDLVGVLMDLFITPEIYFSGQAIGAYNGGAGGYAVGLFGLGYLYPVTHKFSLGTEFAMGSAGGGGIAVGSGLVAQYYLTSEYQLTPELAIDLSVGRFDSLEGEYSADLLQLSLSYRLSNIQAN